MLTKMSGCFSRGRAGMGKMEGRVREARQTDNEEQIKLIVIQSCMFKNMSFKNQLVFNVGIYLL